MKLILFWLMVGIFVAIITVITEIIFGDGTLVKSLIRGGSIVIVVIASEQFAKYKK